MLLVEVAVQIISPDGRFAIVYQGNPNLAALFVASVRAGTVAPEISILLSPQKRASTTPQVPFHHPHISTLAAPAAPQRPIFPVIVGAALITKVVPVPVCEAIAVAFPVDVIGQVRFAFVVTVAAFPVVEAEEPSMLVIPVNASAAEALLSATAVVPI